MSVKKQEGSLNLLKLLATCIIILHHFQQSSGLSFEGKLNFYGGSFYWGHLVELFFILSGYVMYKYSGSLDLDAGFFPFFKKRYTRFLPLLMITGVTSGLMALWRASIEGTIFTHTMWTLLGGMSGFGRILSSNTVINNPTWYISILLWCYAVFYFVTSIAKHRNLHPNSMYLLTMFVGIITYYVCKEYDFSMPFFSSYIGRGLICFFEGLLLRELFEKTKIHEKPLYIIVSLVYLIGFIFIFVKHKAFVSDQLYYIICFTVFPCVILLFKSKAMSMLCAHQVFSVIGNISYHTFMWHITVIRLLLNICAILDVATEDIKLKLMLITLLAAFAVGTLSCYVGSITSSRLKRYAT